GPYACTRYGEVDVPQLPGPRWVRLRTRLGGVCGSDLGIVTLHASPATSPFSSFPFVLGHENVATIEEAGPGVRGWSRGERVVVNPLLGCVPREIDPPCDACAGGQPSRCVRFTDGALPPGMFIGVTRGLGGSWSEAFVANETQLVRVPDGGSDAEAVLVEPFACAVHAVRRHGPQPKERALVVGAGSIGLLNLAALRALAPDAEIVVLARHGFQALHATRLGAARVVMARGDYRAELADAARARLLATVIGPPAAVGGFDRCFVCIDGARAIRDALDFTRAGGTVGLLGNARHLDGVGWAPLWLKELTLAGSLAYGRHAGATTDAFGEALALIASKRADVGPLVTHTFALADHAEALAVAMDKGTSAAVKVAFRP